MSNQQDYYYHEVRDLEVPIIFSNEFLISQNQLAFHNFKLFGGNNFIFVDSSTKHNIVAIVTFTSFEEEFNLDLIQNFQQVAHWLKKASSVYGNITGHGTQGGKMIADGWRKSQDKEAFGRYKPIKIDLKVPQNRVKYNEMNEEVKSIDLFVGNRFQLIANKAFEESHRQLKSIGASSFGEMTHQESIKSHQFSSNMTFTFGDFHNNYHKDEDFSNYSYGIWIPVELEKFNLVKNKESYGVKGGPFVFPSYKCGIDFSKVHGVYEIIWQPREHGHQTLRNFVEKGFENNTRLALSCQIANKLALAYNKYNQGLGKFKNVTDKGVHLGESSN
ncbi:hypothetical protein O181_007632 [Austropuccinia psidii MF-1]|uniref:Tet-like 2OG-Fe(II) oxygenase domain-containing protein n=1 Tax=Austropuccinia psidii MF-1 TaxID=1389203 RepID=A0A9Q3BMB5_9BASI|nr:hypothetical protein [Austropuccinia psidii MF-1]